MKDFSVKRKTACGILIALIILTIAFIWGNSVLPMARSAEESAAVSSFLQRIIDAIFGEGTFAVSESFIRKAAHFSEFFALGVEIYLLIIAVKKASLPSYFCALPVGLFVAVIDEGIQVLSQRGAAVKDIFIDYGGYLAAAVLFILIFIIRRAVKNKKRA